MSQSNTTVEKIKPPTNGGHYPTNQIAFNGKSLVSGALRNLAWILLTTAVLLASMELIFRIAHIGEEEFVQITPVVGFWHAPNRLVTWRAEGYSQGRTNSDGMRDIEYAVGKPAGIKRIAVIGDSMAEGFQVDSSETFAKQLEHRLNRASAKVQVMNFGMSGFSTVQELYLFKEKIAKYKPDICILAYHVNDSDKNTNCFGIDKSLPRPYCYISANNTLMTDWQSYDSWHSSPAAEVYKQTAALRSSSRIWAVLTKIDLQLSALGWYGQLKNVFTRPAKPTAAVAMRTSDTGIDVVGRPYVAPTVEPPGAINGAMSTEGSPASLAVPTGMTPANGVPSALPVQAPRAVAAPVPTAMPMPVVAHPNDKAPSAVYQDRKTQKEIENNHLAASQMRQALALSQLHFKVTAAVIGELNQVCRAAHCKLMVAALPAPNNSMMFFRELLSMRPLSQKCGFTFVDLNPAFPSLAPMQDSSLYYRIHYTPQGHAVIARALEKALDDAAMIR